MKVTHNVFDTLRQRFDTTQLVELTSTIATYNIVPRLLMALRVLPEE